MKTQGSWNWTFPGNFHLFWFFPGCFLVELVLEIAIYKLLELQLVSRKNLRTQNKKTKQNNNNSSNIKSTGYKTALILNSFKSFIPQK